MNIRQLSQGLLPTPEYEFHHTYYSLRKFPELNRTMKQMKEVQLKSTNITQSDYNNQKNILKNQSSPSNLINQQSKSQQLGGYTSTHHLDELSKSCLNEITSLSDYRKILLQNRMKLKSSDHTSSQYNNNNNTNNNKKSINNNTLIANNDSNIITDNDNDDQQSKVSDITYSQSHIELANQKLTKISISFDSQNYHSHLKGFTEGS